MVLLLWLLACNPVSSVALAPGADPAGQPADTAPEALPGDSDPATVEFGCAPQAKDQDVDERDAVVLSFHCTGSTPADAWELVSGPPEAAFDGATGALTWQTDLASGGTWPVVVHAVHGTDREEGTATIWVVDAWDARGNEEINPSTYTMEHGIPVIHLEGVDALEGVGMQPLEVTYRGRPFVGAEGQYRGAASSYYPKKSYRIDFAPDDEFEDEEEGFPKRRSIVLTTLFDDNAYFRQMMVFDIWNLLGEPRPVVTTFVIVYLDRQYQGLYLLGDHLDGEWFEDQGYPEDGNLYKSVDHSANFYETFNGGAKSSWHSGYEKKDGLPDTDFSDLDALVEFVSTASDAEFDAGIADRVDLEDVYDWWALVVFTEADDSGGKNCYLYNDPAAPTFRFEPWDYNHSLGQTWQTERESGRYDYDFGGNNGLFARLIGSETYGPEISERFRTARRTVLANEQMQTLIDSYIERIDDSARRDWDKWGSEYRAYAGWNWRTDWTSHDEEVQYVRDWVEIRTDFIDQWDP
ncbi:MAG: hypothetical protein EXR71_05215 [Myxococcales bacterium]|nr:hypothetical protein [Myxococcales bacterium]